MLWVWHRLWIKRTLNKYPVIRGMLSYALVWPCSNITQQCMDKRIYPSEADWWAAARFGFFGAFFISPVFYNWMKFTDRFYTEKSLKIVIKRTIIERLTYSPLVVVYFFLGITLLETGDFKKAIDEVKLKFWPTWSAAIVYFTIVQIGNYYLIPLNYRVPYVAVCGYLWAIYMSHMKMIKLERLKQPNRQ